MPNIFCQPLLNNYDYVHLKGLNTVQTPLSPIWQLHNWLQWRISSTFLTNTSKCGTSSRFVKATDYYVAMFFYITLFLNARLPILSTKRGDYGEITGSQDGECVCNIGAWWTFRLSWCCGFCCWCSNYKRNNTISFLTDMLTNYIIRGCVLGTSLNFDIVSLHILSYRVV